MKITIYKYLSLLLLLLCLGLTSTGQDKSKLWKQEFWQKENIQDNVFRIKFNEDQFAGDLNKKASSFAGIELLNQKNQIKRMERVFPFSLKYEARHRKHGLHLWYELEVPAGTSLSAVMEQYGQLPEVALVKPVMQKVDYGTFAMDSIALDALIKVRDPKFKKAETAEVDFDDPRLAEQWHYENDGSLGAFNEDIDLFGAWEITTGSKDVIVAIVDGGIDTGHEDLEPNIWTNELEANGVPGVDDDGNGYVDDVHGYNFKQGKSEIVPTMHGTHVAGTVAAVNNNGVGVGGVAGGDGTEGSGIQLISCQIFSHSGESGNSAGAIVYGADNGAVISQNSWGYNRPGYMEPEVEAAIYYFREEAGQYEGSPMKGGILFFASGNTGRNELHMPGAHEAVYGVASTGPEGYPSYFSTYGDWVDISAPGGDQSYGEEAGVLSTVPGGYYHTQGTSMACPHVSGVAALVLSNSDEQMTPDELWGQLSGGTRPFKFDSQGLFGVGALNAKGALVPDQGIAPEAITDFRAEEPAFDSFTFHWSVPADEDNEAPALFYLALNETELNANNFFASPRVFVFWNGFEAGSEVKVTISGLEPSTQYWAAMHSEDSYRNLSEISNVVEAFTTAPPVFTISDKEIAVEIDAANPVVNVDIRLANEGEGTLEWMTSTENVDMQVWNGYYQDLAKRKVDEFRNKATIMGGVGKKSGSAASIVEMPAHWDNENTKVKGGLRYDQGDWADYVTKVGSENSLISAVKFRIPTGQGINITHVEWGMYVDSLEIANEAILELRAGEDLNTAKVLTRQIYDTQKAKTSKLALHRTALYEPQFMTSEEYVWVVLYHPRGEEWGLAYQRSNMDSYAPGYFMMSYDVGNSWDDAQGYFYRNASYMAVPLMRLGTTGKEGPFVFLNPTSGSLEEGEQSVVQLTVDNASLDNGYHWSTLVFATNDPEHPLKDIDVYVHSSGKTPKVTMDELRLEGYQGVGQEVELSLKNAGGDSLIIKHIYTDYQDINHSYEKDLVLRAKSIMDIPVPWNPSMDIGYLKRDIHLATNHGILSFPISSLIKEAPTASMHLPAEVLNVNMDGSAEYVFEIENTSASAELEIDLSHYLNRDQTGAVDPITSYNMEVLNDPGKWEDVEGLVELERLIINPFDPKFWEFDMPFQMFGQKISKFRYEYEGMMSSNGTRMWIQDRFPNSFYAGPTFVAFLQNDFWGYRAYTAEHSFGDHQVYTVKNEWPHNNYSLGIEFQVALYDTGVIEYRYRNVDLPDSLNYQVGIQGYDALVSKTFSDGSDDFVNGRLKSGMVIRFTPEQNLNSNMVVNSSDSKVVLHPGERKSFGLTVKPSHVVRKEGDYTVPFYIGANLGEGSLSGKFTISVSGSSSYAYEDEISFEAFSGYEESQLLALENTGNSLGEISQIQISNPSFELSDLNVGDKIGAAAIVYPKLVYTPSVEEGTESGILRIEMIDGESIEVNLSAQVNPAPTLETTFDQALSFDFNDMSAQELNLRISEVNGGIADYALIGGKYVSPISTVASTRADTLMYQNHLDVDDFGYRKQIMREGTVAFKWEDGDDYESINVVDGVYHTVNLDFDFPYYDESYSEMHISDNGYICFNLPNNADSDQLIAQGWLDVKAFSEDGIAGTIAPFANFNDPQHPGEIRVYRRDDHMVVRWKDWMNLESSDLVDFELFMYDNGDIYFAYKSVERYTTIFQTLLEGPQEKIVNNIFQQLVRPEGVDYIPSRNEEADAFNPINLGDSTVVKISRPYKLNGQSESTQDIALKVAPELIPENGSFVDTLLLISNDPGKADVKWPIHVNLSAPAIFEVAESYKRDSVVVTEEQEYRFTLLLKNLGPEELEIDKLTSENLDNLVLYNAKGEVIPRSSSGYLAPTLRMPSRSELSVTVGFVPGSNMDVSGALNWETNGGNLTTTVDISTLGIPNLAWDLQDASHNLLQKEDLTITYNLSNDGDSKSDYTLTAFVPSSKEVGREFPYFFDERQSIEPGGEVIASWSDPIDQGLPSSAPDRIMGGTGIGLAQGNEFRTGDEAQVISHISAQLTFDERFMKTGIKVWVMIGDHPDFAETIYESFYMPTEPFNREWVNFELQKPLEIPANTTYYLMISYPSPVGDILFFFEQVVSVTTDDEDLAKRAWVRWDGEMDWTEVDEEGHPRWGYIHPNDGFTLNFDPTLYRIRAVLGAEELKGVTFSPSAKGVVEAGEQLSVSATLPGTIFNSGEKGVMLGVVDSITGTMHESRQLIAVNGAPEWIYTPNTYGKELRIKETEELTAQYVVKDQENDQITVRVEEVIFKSVTGEEVEFTGPEATIQGVGNGHYNVVFDTDYDNAGEHDYLVIAEDSQGNSVADSLHLEVINVNRAPVFDENFRFVYLNLADPANSAGLDMTEVFSDPDGDELQYLSANYTPDMVELAAGSRFLDIHPLQEGVGIVLVAAQDAHGVLVIEPVYVIISNDEDSVGGTPNGIQPEDLNIGDGQFMMPYPNPVVDGNAYVALRLDEIANGELLLMDSFGKLIDKREIKQYPEGMHSFHFNLDGLAQGVYIYQLVLDGETLSTAKILVQ